MITIEIDKPKEQFLAELEFIFGMTRSAKSSADEHEAAGSIIRSIASSIKEESDKEKKPKKSMERKVIDAQKEKDGGS